MSLQKLIRILHRDLGYIFFAVTIIYCISGIALNHKNDWNPNYIIKILPIKLDGPVQKDNINENWIKSFLTNFNQKENYKKYYLQNEKILKIFLQGGYITLDLTDGTGTLETIRKRPFFKELNFLHYNNIRHLWTYVSDVFALSLIIIAVTGLFLVKGKNGITGRGAWLTAIGIIIPILFLLAYL